jgi:mono/diheme cytochrome c family protein
MPFAVGKQTVIFPGFDGGAEWGGPAIDPATDILYVNATEMAWTGGLVEAHRSTNPGEQVYQSQCAMCHGTNLEGAPPAFPSLVDVLSRLKAEKVINNVKNGTGRMPSFPNIDDAQMKVLIEYLRAGSSGVRGDAGKELTTVPAQEMTARAPADWAGATVYANRCARCHGSHMEGIAPANPMLIGAGTRLSKAQIVDFVQNGTDQMPAMPDVQGADLEALLRYMGVADGPKTQGSVAEDYQDKFTFTGYRKFLDPDGYPAIAPPWGTLNAIDLKTGKYVWKIPLGEYPELARQGMKNTGTETYGGPIVTAGGLVFIGATVYDRKFRAFDSRSGKLLWETELPFAGVATPSTYMIDGQQYVAIAASGARDPKGPAGGAYVAFSLPK